MEDHRLQSLIEIQTNLQYQFTHLSFLDQALTHSSFCHETREENVSDNERLEFLGDAVLNFIVSNYLYQTYTDITEGRLAKLKAVVVSEPILAQIAKELNLGKYLLLGKGEQKTGGAERNSILGDAYEAVIGAIFLDGDITPVQAFILRKLIPVIKMTVQASYLQDYKSILQEFVQANFATTPHYNLVNESGPDHDKRFLVKVTINKDDYGSGDGKNKKEAEQKAAQQACMKLNILKEN